MYEKLQLNQKNVFSFLEIFFTGTQGNHSLCWKENY